MEAPSGKRQLTFQIMEYQVFKDMGPASWDCSKLKNAPKDLQKIKIDSMFAVNMMDVTMQGWLHMDT